MAAEHKARQKSLNGWRKREGGFNYKLANRSATMSVAHLPDLSRARILPRRQQQILERILFVLYLLSLLNGRAPKGNGFGRSPAANAKPLPRANSPPKHFGQTRTAATVKRAGPGVVHGLIALLLSMSLTLASPLQKYPTAKTTPPTPEFALPAFVSLRTAIPAVDHPGRYMLACAPQDRKTFNQRLPDWPAVDAGINIDIPDLSDPYHAQKFFNDYDGPIPKAKLKKILTARQQAMLKDLGYYKGKIDSLAGPMTRRALKRFERESNSQDWQVRYALALKFFEAGKKTGKIDYYNKTVDHLYWIAYTYSILLPTKVRDEMYDLLVDMASGYSLHSREDWRKVIEEKIGALAWYGSDEPTKAKEFFIRTMQACIYLFPNRGPPRNSLRWMGEEDEIPIPPPQISWDEIRVLEGWESASEEQVKIIYYKIFPERAKKSKKEFSKSTSSGNHKHNQSRARK